MIPTAVFHMLLRVDSIPTLHLKTFKQLFWTTWRKNLRKGQWQAQSRYLCHCSCFVPLRQLRENLNKPFYFYLSPTCDPLGGSPLVISLALILCCSVRGALPPEAPTSVAPLDPPPSRTSPAAESNYLLSDILLLEKERIVESFRLAMLSAYTHIT